MARVYGMADGERQLLNHLPGEVKSIDDIPKIKKQFERKFKKKDTGFFAGIRKWNILPKIGEYIL